MNAEVVCKICGKSIYRIFVEHIQAHLDEDEETIISMDIREIQEERAGCLGCRIPLGSLYRDTYGILYLDDDGSRNISNVWGLTNEVSKGKIS